MTRLVWTLPDGQETARWAEDEGGGSLPEQWTVNEETGSLLIAAEDPDAPALTVTNTGPTADLAVFQGDDALYQMDAEGQMTIQCDTGTDLILRGLGGTDAHLSVASVGGGSASVSANGGYSWASAPGVFVFGVGTDGLSIGFTSAPDLSGYDPGTLFFWFDDTHGAAKLMIKAKDANGTVVTGSVNLA